jgi:hypothetical protein
MSNEHVTLEHFTLDVNATDHEVNDSWLGESLLDVLRDRLGFMGTKGACEQGECGSCSVMVDGVLVCSCLVMAASAVGQPIVTIEGVAPAGAPSDVQAAFVECGAVQCGFCTPGSDRGGPRPARTVPATDRHRDPRGARGQRVSLHRLRTDHRRRPAGGGPSARGCIVSVVERVAAPTTSDSGRHGTIGTSPTRPDGIAKVQGSFEFSSDLSAEGCLWGATLRSPHPYARIVSIDVTPAWRSTASRP